MDFSGLLVCHSRDLAEMNCSGFVFVAIYLRLTTNLKWIPCTNRSNATYTQDTIVSIKQKFYKKLNLIITNLFPVWSLHITALYACTHAHTPLEGVPPVVQDGVSTVWASRQQSLGDTHQKAVHTCGVRLHPM